MKRLLVVLVALGALLLPIGGSAAPMKHDQRLPLNDDFDACQEQVLVTGTQHIVMRVSADGGQVVFTRNSQGTGTGDLSGARYQFSDHVTYVTRGVTEGGTTTFTQVVSTRLVRQGEPSGEDDLLVTWVLRGTIGADGFVTYTIQKQDAICL